MRADLNKITEWIQPNTRILDLGCGNGVFLKNLQKTHHIQGYGLEINPKKLAPCIANGINVIQADLNKGLTQYFDDHSFDYVIMSQTLQATQRPDLLLKEMLRVGKRAIVTFPNHAHWKNRFQLAVKGIMPITRILPYQWYSTPNIHLCTVKDFEILCKENDFQITKREVVNKFHQQTKLMQWQPNLFGEIAIYQFKNK